MGGSRSHWEHVHSGRAPNEVSWYQLHAVRSLELIEKAAPEHTSSVVDVGGGASPLVDGLLARGFGDIAVLDITETALARARARLGAKAQKIAWIRADVTEWKPARTWDIWHDRAVFHFLTGKAQQDDYIGALSAATRPGATVIISTFAPDGPARCSGLPVQRYDAETLAARLGPLFALRSSSRESHVTPWQAEQRFSYAVLQRLGSN